MIDLSSVEDVRALQSNLRVVFGTEQGKEVMTFLEQLCGWFDFEQIETNMILIGHGRRQVLATIKTLLDKKPDEIVALSHKE